MRTTNICRAPDEIKGGNAVPAPSRRGPTGRPLRPHWPRLVDLLHRHGITLVIDVGANVGQYAGSLRASGYRSRIVSFEPLSSAHAELARAADDDAGWTVAARSAVGATAGSLTVNVSASSDMSSALPFTAEAETLFDGDRFVGREDVPMTTVDAIVAEHAGPDDRVFLKSDTQGYDLEVLRGATASLHRIAGLQIEASLHSIYQGQPNWRDIVEFATPYGFAIDFIIPGYYSKARRRLMEFDIVFARR